MIGRLAILAALLAEGLVFGTVAELLAASYDSSDPHAVSAWAFCFVALSGYGIPRLVEGFDLSPRTGYVLTGVLGTVVIYSLLRITLYGDIAIWQLGWIGDFLSDAQTTAEKGGHTITGAILLIATWARATLRSADEIEMESIPRSVAVPFALVTTFVVLGAVTDRSGEVGRVGAAFYVAAILSLTCSQLAMSGATFGELRAGGTAAVLLAGTAIVAVVGLVIITLVTTVLGPIVGPIISKTVQITLTIILTPFAWVLTALFDALFAGANPFPNITEQVANTSRDAADPSAAEQSQASKVSLFFMRTLALVVMLGVVALLMTVFVRLRKRSADRLLDGRESSAIGDLRTDLGSMFRSLMGRRKAREPGEATTEATRLYLEVLARAEQTGHARPTGETAREFAPVLNQTFATPVTDDITKAFEAARYAGREPDARTIEELRRRWEQNTER